MGRGRAGGIVNPRAVRRFAEAMGILEKTGGTKLLRLGTAVGNPALFEGADDLREEMTLLALVELGMSASARFRAFEPVEHEEREFDPPQLPECEVELVLAAAGREFSQNDGRRHDAGLQRRARA